MNFKDQVLKNSEVELDGNHYIRCTFRNAKLVFRGKALPTFDNCLFDNIKFALRDGADQTAAFLFTINHLGFGEGVQNLIKGVRGDGYGVLDSDFLE